MDDNKIFAKEVNGEQKFLDTPMGLKLHDQGKRLAELLNEINDTLKENGKFNFSDYHQFGEVAKYIRGGDRANVKIEVNAAGIYGLVHYK